MNIGIVGAGLTGCTLARLLVDRGHTVILFEKKNRIGGLCVSQRHENGSLYEPYGARTFHTANRQVKMFALRYSHFNGYRHRKGIIIKNRLLPFPITVNAIALLPDSDNIIGELELRPQEVDYSNLETASISLFGPTLYEYFICNYTRRMWGIAPSELSAYWVPNRLVLRECNTEEIFKDEWQGLPIEGYSAWLERMTEGIPVKTGVDRINTQDFDVVISTAPIDEMAGYRYGRLEYRSLKFIYTSFETWENDRYGTINLPEHPRFIRKCNFRILHREANISDFIQYQEPCAAGDSNIPMYPVQTKRNELLFQKYLSYMVSLPNLCPAGRLGLFEYLDMDEAVSCAMKLVPFIEKYNEFPPKQRMQELIKIKRHSYYESNQSRSFKD